MKTKKLNFITLLVLGAAIFSCAKDDAITNSPTSAEITEFSFKNPDVKGTISGDDINITVPGTADITKLVAIFTTEGASVKVGETPQVSGTTPNDFTNAVNYTVTSQDGTVNKTYKVTVSKQTATSKDITSFSFVGFPDAVAIISGTNISLALPEGTVITNLVANFSHNGASVKVGETEQKSGETSNNFTSPVTYIVTDKSGGTQNYTVTVTVARPSVAEITAFSFADPKGIINPVATINQTNGTIDVVVSAGADLTKLVATFASAGTVKVGSGVQTSETTVNDFSAASGVTYTVTSQDGKATKNYVVKVTKTNFATIPDASFLAFLKGYVPNAFGGIDNNQLDINHADVTSKTSMNCKNRTPKIADLTGIEYFVGLTYLDCSFNSLKSLDLSKNTYLTTLGCQYNSLTSLDVSKNTALTTLDCSTNSLTSLDVSNNTALTELGCQSNSLETLDVSKNTALKILNCNHNSLEILDVSNNTALTTLDCNNNSLETLDVSNNTALELLTCDNNSLKSLDVSNNTALKTLGCYANLLTTLDISSQTSLTNLLINGTTAGENPITTLKVNVSRKDHAQVKLVKTKKPTCVISTYLGSSKDIPSCPDYNPLTSDCHVPAP